MDKYSVPSFTTTAREVLTDVYIAKEVDAEIAELKKNTLCYSDIIKIEANAIREMVNKSDWQHYINDLRDSEDTKLYLLKYADKLEKGDE